MAFAFGDTIGELGANILRRSALEDAAAAARRQQENDLLKAIMRGRQEQQQQQQSNELARALADADRQFRQQQLGESARQFDTGLSAQSKSLADQLAAQERIAGIQAGRVDPRIEVERIRSGTDQELIRQAQAEAAAIKNEEVKTALTALRMKNATLKADRDKIKEPIFHGWLGGTTKKEGSESYLQALRPLIIQAEQFGFKYDPTTEDFYLPGEAGGPTTQPQSPIPIPILPFNPSALGAEPAQAPAPLPFSQFRETFFGRTPPASPATDRTAMRNRLRELINSGMSPEAAAQQVRYGR